MRHPPLSHHSSIISHHASVVSHPPTTNHQPLKLTHRHPRCHTAAILQATTHYENATSTDAPLVVPPLAPTALPPDYTSLYLTTPHYTSLHLTTPHYTLHPTYTRTKLLNKTQNLLATLRYKALSTVYLPGCQLSVLLHSCAHVFFLSRHILHNFISFVSILSSPILPFHLFSFPHPRQFFAPQTVDRRPCTSSTHFTPIRSSPTLLPSYSTTLILSSSSFSSYPSTQTTLVSFLPINPPIPLPSHPSHSLHPLQPSQTHSNPLSPPQTSDSSSPLRNPPSTGA
jgi:hypothetical protein